LFALRSRRASNKQQEGKNHQVVCVGHLGYEAVVNHNSNRACLVVQMGGGLAEQTQADPPVTTMICIRGFLFVAGRRTIDTPYKNDVQLVGLGISMSTADISFSPIKEANFLVFF
jgi:hypothetical protein